MELDPPAIEIVPENNPWNVLELVRQNDPWSILDIVTEIDLGNALENASMHSRDRTSIRKSRRDPGDQETI